MKNEELKITLQNTNNGNIIGLQNKFTTIFYEQYKKWQEAQPFQKIAPIDLVIDVNETDLNKTEFDRLFLHHINAAKTASINKINAEKFLKTASNYFTEVKSIEKNIVTITVPFLIELIVHKFLNKKGIKSYEKMQWINLIAFFTNIKPENEVDSIQKFISDYGTYIGLFGHERSGNEISEKRLANRYFKLASYIKRLIRENKAKYLTTSTSNNLSNNTVQNIDYTVIAINDLYLRNPKYSRYTKKYWKGIIKHLSQEKPTLKSISSLPQFNQLQQYINNNTSAIENKLQEKLLLLTKSLTKHCKYSYEKFNSDISTTQLILAITEKFLTQDGLYSNEIEYWLTIIEDLIAKKTDVATVLLAPENTPLKLFLYDDYLLRPKERPQKINIESYRETLIIELKRIIQDFLKTTVSTDTQTLTSLYRLIYYSLHELEKGLSVLETLEKYNSLFLVLDGFMDIKQFSNYNSYPLIAPLYTKFVNSKAYKHLNDKILFKLKNYLDEVIVKATKSTKTIEISNLYTDSNDEYYVIKPQHIFYFVTKFLNQKIAFNSILSNQFKGKEIGLEGKEFTYKNLRYNIYRFDPKAFYKTANLNPDSFEFKYTSNKFHYNYSLYVKDINGENLFWFTTTNYSAFEKLSEKLKFTPNSDTINQLIIDYRSDFKKAGNNKDKIDKLYASLPTAFFNRENNNNAINDHTLKKGLTSILKGTVDETWGTNEEMAIVNIVKAMSTKFAYDLFRENTKLLHTVFRKMHQYWVSTGTAYQDFSDYMISLILMYGSQIAHTAVWFSNENWAFNRIEIEISDWSEKTKELTLDNYYQKGWIPLFNLNGTNEFLSNTTQKYHPLDLVEMQTMVNDKPVSVVKIPMFMLYHKAVSKANWDTFNIVTDIISVLSVYGAGRVLISKTVSLGAKALAGAVIMKEISTKTIQHEGLTSWLKRKHETLYTAWTTTDTIGDFALLFTSITKADELITNSRNLLGNLQAAEIKVPNKYLEWLEKAKKALGELFDPNTGKKIVLSLEGSSKSFPIHIPTNVLYFNKTLDEAGNTFRNILNNKPGKIKEHLKKDLGKLIENATGKFRDDLTNLAVSLRGFSGDNQKLYNYIVEFERIKLAKGKSVLNGEQIKALQDLEPLLGVNKKIVAQFINTIFKEGKNIADLKYLFNVINEISPKNIEHLLKIINNFEDISTIEVKTLLIKLCLQNDNAETLATFTKKELAALSKGLAPNTKFGNAKGNFINKKEFFDQLTSKELKKFKESITKHPHKSFDLDFLQGKRKLIKDRFEEARIINMNKNYRDVAQIAEDGKTFFENVNKQIKEFILNEKQIDFDNFINMYRINGKVDNDFMPKYKKFCEGMIEHRGKKITNAQLKEIMDNMRRHHIIMASVLKDNSTFQKIMQWAKNQDPPKGIGFHNFRENIIILHHDQHGFHNIATDLMQKKMNNLNEIFNATEKKINNLKELVKHGTDENFMEAFLDLKNILKDEKQEIIKNVIQKSDSHLDTKHVK